MILVNIKPAKSMLKRRQWGFEIRGGNGERIDPRDTYNNRGDAVDIMEKLIGGDEPVQLVIMDRYGEVEERRELRQ
jgi:hypothetical protein